MQYGARGRETTDKRGDGEGLLPEGSRNFSRPDVNVEFVTDSYLAMLGAAWMEGGTVSARKGLRQGPGEAASPVDDRAVDAFAFGVLPGSAPFGRHYSAAPARIFPVVEALLPGLGYDWELRNESPWYLATEFRSPSRGNARAARSPGR